MQDDTLAREEIVDGDKIGGDKISVGNISDSYTAIGAGAQVIVNQIQQALSVVDELDKSIQAAERRLAEAIQRILGGYTKLAAPDVDARSNPYKALLDYKLEDAPFFYGRADAIAAMQARMQQSRLTILHSDSGSGKTSLLQAGLASRFLAAGQFPLYLRPYDQRPDHTIKRAFLPDYAVQDDLARFRDEQMALKGFLERVGHYLGERQLVIFLDQFEEFFTELAPEQQEEFANQLRECVESDLPVWWVLALRKEYFSDLRLFTALKPFENEYFLPTFRLEEAQEVVVQPAALKGISYEKGLVERILADIGQNSNEIPPAQVQLVCYTLFDELNGNRGATEITFALYNRPRGRGAGAAGAEGILTSHLGRVLDRELKGQERIVASRVLEELVTSDVRRVIRSEATLKSVLDPQQAALLAQVLAVLYNNRLVRRELDENDQPVYELAHDYLLNEIELDPDTQARKAAQELLDQEAHAYRQHGTLLNEDKFVIINNQREFLQIDETAGALLQESAAAIEKERRQEIEQAQKLAEEQRLRAEEGETAARRLRTRLILASAAVVVALIAFAAALWFGVNANQQESIAVTAAANATRSLATAVAAEDVASQEREKAVSAQGEAERQAGIAQEQAVIAQEQAGLAQQQAGVATARLLLSHPQQTYDSSLLYAVEAVRATERVGLPTLREANTLLRQSLLDSPLAVSEPVYTNQGWPLDVQLNADGTRALGLASHPAVAVLWDVTSGAIMADLLAGVHVAETDAWPSGAFNASGDRLFVQLGRSGTVLLGNAQTGDIVAALQHPLPPATDLASYDVRFSPQGSKLITYDRSAERVFVWDAATGMKLLEAAHHVEEARTDLLDLVQFDADEGLVTTFDDSQLQIWDLATETAAAAVVNNARAIGFSPDGLWVTVETVLENYGTFSYLYDSRSGEALVDNFPASWVTPNLLAFDPGGTKMVTAQNGYGDEPYSQLHLWDVPSRELLHSAEVANFSASHIVFDTEGEYLAVSDAGQSLLIKASTFISQPLPGGNAAFSPDGRYLATNRILMDLLEGAAVTELGGDSTVTFSPDSSRLLVPLNSGGAAPSSVRGLVNTISGEVIDSGLADNATFLDNGRKLLSGSSLFDARTGRLLRDFGTMDLLGMSPDGKRVMASHAGSIVQWDARPYGPEPMVVAEWGHTGTPTTLSFTPDGKYVILNGADSAVWDTASGEMINSTVISYTEIAATPAGDGSYALRELISQEGGETLLDLASGTSLLEIPGTVPGYSEFSPDGRWLVRSSYEFSSVEAVNQALDGAAVWLPQVDLKNSVLGWSGAIPILATIDADNTVHLWDLIQEQEITQLRHAAEVQSIIFSPDGSTVFTADRDSVLYWWDVHSGEKKSTSSRWLNYSLYAFTPSPNGSRFASGSGMYVQNPRLWDVANGVELGTLHRSGSMSEFFFNPSGDRLVIDTGSGVELVNAINGESIAGVDGFQLESNSFSADGTLAALSDWSEVEIRNTSDGRLLTTLPHNTRVRAVAFSPDKKLLATATDYAIRLWHIDEEYLVDLACDLAHRNMTYEEWVSVLGDQPYRKSCPEWPVHPSVHEAAAEMARMGDEEGARTLYEHISELEADFTAQDARQAFNDARAQGLVNDAAALADAGRIAEALENYEQARNLSAVFIVADRLWMDVCYYGALQGQTLEIADACNMAVDLFSNRMDSFGQRAFEGRAILRAQLGAYEDAKQDLQIVVDALSATSPLLPTRMAWLEQLQDGQNPFAQETLGEVEVICPSC